MCDIGSNWILELKYINSIQNNILLSLYLDTDSDFEISKSDFGSEYLLDDKTEVV